MALYSRPILPLLVLGAVLGLSSCANSGNAGGKAVTKLATENDSLAYVLGLGYAEYLKTLPVTVNLDVVLQAIRDRTADKELLISSADANQIRMTLGQRIQDKEMAKLTEKNNKESEAFLTENKAKANVKTTASGLQYEVIKEGAGAKPAATSTVKVHYVGTLLDGTKFDSSRDRGEPVEFPLNMVIKGWTEGVQLMSKGATYKFWIPGSLAYGERGAPPKIGPNATLVFEVELLDIVKP